MAEKFKMKNAVCLHFKDSSFVISESSIPDIPHYGSI